MRTLAMAWVVLMLLSAPAAAQWTDDAQKCVDAPDADSALAHCTRAVESGKLGPAGVAVALNNRGNAYQQKRDYDRAIQDYNEAARHDPYSALVRNNRGTAYQHKGDYDRALQDYDEAIRLDSESALAFNNRGRAHHFKGNYPLAIKDYDEAIELQPEYALAYYNRGLARFDQGLYINSLPDFVRALSLDPGSPYRAIGLYLAKARAGDVDRDGLASNTKALNAARWPGPIVAMYLGQLTPPALLEGARDPDSTTQRERQCEAFFYAGQHLMIAGQREAAAKMFEAAVATGVTSYYEYVSARAELRRLGR